MQPALSKNAHPLKDLLDLPQLQRMLELLYAASGIPSGIVSLEGDVLAGAGWQPLCTQFHRQHPVCSQRCHTSDTQLAIQAQNLARLATGQQEFQYAAYKCANGLWDLAIPIVIEGKHLGNYFLGQFLYAEEEIDWGFFSRQAQEMGFDEAGYLTAVRALPRFTHERVEAMLRFNQSLVTYLSQLGSQQLSQLHLLHKLNQSKTTLLDQDRRLNAALPSGEPAEVLQQVVHDLKTPLNGIFGMAQLIRMSLENPQRAEVDRFLTMILESTRSMVNQIDDLLSLSEAESSQTRVKAAPLFLGPLLGRLQDAFGQLALLRQIELEFICHPQLQVLAHERTLYTVLANLLSNALKYSPAGTRVEVVGQVQGEQLLLKVIDEGTGILAREEPLLFQKFATLSNRPLAGESSTGIGLYTAKRLAEKQGGSLVYQPNRPQGSCFIVTLPRAPSPL